MSLGKLDLQPVILAVRAEVENAHGVIHVTLHEVAAKTVPNVHGTFDIYQRSILKVSEACDTECLPEQVKGKSSCNGVDVCCREAAVVHGHAFAELELRRDAGGLDDESCALAAGFEGDNFASGFNETGEHAVGLRVQA